jgi:hypothetical protein
MNKSKINTHSIWQYFFVILGFIALQMYFTFYEGKLNSNTYSFLTRSWGFNHIKFYSTPYIISFYAVLLFLAIPATNGFVIKFIETISIKLKRLNKVKIILFILFGFIASYIFYVFKNKYYLLGDYNLRVNQTMKQDFLVTEYLTMKLLYIIASFLEKHSITPTQSFVYVSCLSGGIYVTINCFIADLLGKTSYKKIVLALGGIVSGMLLIFCGYLDIYALPVAFTAIYIYSTLLYIKNKNYFWLALLFLVVSVSAHLLCISFAPALFIAWYYHNNKKIPQIAKLKNKTKVYSILVLIFLCIVVVYKLKTGFVLPIKAPPTNPKYLTLLSYTHLWEFLNGQLLGAGVSFIALIYLIYIAIKNKIVLSIETYVLLTSTLGMTLTVFLANVHRGSGDWDILSLTAIAINSFVILTLINLPNAYQKIANYLIIIIIGFNILNAVLWIHINSTDKSISKIENMLTNDPGPYYTSKLPSIIQLIYMYKENNLMADAERISLKACDMLYFTDFRGCLMHGDILVSQKRNKDATAFYEQLLDRNPNIPQAYNYLIYEYQNSQQNQKIIPIISKFYNSFKSQPNTFLAYMKPEDCLNIIEYLYNFNGQNNIPTNFNEMSSIINQLKQLQKQNASPKK